jgi:hypothetical protein
MWRTLLYRANQFSGGSCTRWSPAPFAADYYAKCLYARRTLSTYNCLNSLPK